MNRIPLLPSLVVLTLVLLALCLTSLSSGVMNLPLSQALLAIGDHLFGASVSSLKAHEQAVVWELRLPRTALAVFAGIMLSQCGAVMQGLFRNPLADPGVIGVSSGAAVGAVLAIFFSPQSMVWWTVPVSAFSGGFACSLFIYRLAHSNLGTSILVLLLAGIAVSAFSFSIIGLLSYLSDDSRLRDLTMWQLGSLAGANATEVWMSAVVAGVLSLRFQYRASALNAMLLGEAEARHLGIDVESLKRELIILTALGVGLAVACAGVISFIGLVVPHAVRTLNGPDHRSLLPLSALLGGTLLLCADIVARLAVQPAELPVGLLTALLGAPFFVMLLLQLKERA
ncbi:MAG: iron ABC transporter permease [Halieaceae bacterium]|jgi:iron complex transport system permease protein|nr:iron ABC transporter permease [Halieaceae bacterium]